MNDSRSLLHENQKTNVIFNKIHFPLEKKQKNPTLKVLEHNNNKKFEVCFNDGGFFVHSIVVNDENNCLLRREREQKLFAFIRNL